MPEIKAKQLAYRAYSDTLPYLRRYYRLTAYGQGETVDTLWSRLPNESKAYWMGRA